MSRIIIVFCLFAFSCEQSEYTYQYERYIDSVYSEPFNSDGFVPDMNDPKRLYEKFEAVLLEAGYIHSIAREAYLILIRQLIADSLSLDINQISEKLGQKSFYFESPSYSYLSFEAYEKASKKYYHEGNIEKINGALQNIVSNGDLTRDVESMKGFLYSIDESDFQGDIIYRIPIIQIVYLHGVD
ncbi:hypothetical protein AB9P05_05355 [Roseivirga sp. BDSF3-8]|uniref:hypothetical protein n=1 Tax=Roseivirga sp. BDSF3-8 TaxID=3241598 RepID=UPI003531E563